MVNRFKLIRQASRNPKEPKTENRSNTEEKNPNVYRLKLKSGEVSAYSFLSFELISNNIILLNSRFYESLKLVVRNLDILKPIS